jgi:probable phosphoglycerate mutase
MIAGKLEIRRSAIVSQRIIYLARHGETDWNRQNRWQGHTDIVLNESGRAQAGLLADRVRDIGLVRVHSSDLVRARETGEIVAARLDAPFGGIDARLRERSFGLFEGLTREECAAHHPEHWRRYLADSELMPPGAEPRDLVAERMLAGVHAVASGEGDGPVLIVSHGSAIRALVAAVTGVLCPPMANGALFRIVVRPDAEAHARFVSAERLAG